MEYISTEIEGLFVVKPRVFADERGYFFESYSKLKEENSGINYNWVQDNESFSERGVLRGMHYQCGEHAQAKLVRVIKGEVQDIVVDIRPNSPTYGKYFSIVLSETNKEQLLVPRGLAHGFLVLSEKAIFSYKCDNFYNKESEGGIHFLSESLKLPWEKMGKYTVSEKDEILPSFGNHKSVQ
jgi:dTDP-4-dehydrorhamnose 3,5-epimerase